ncbi:MAG: hypothetical protein AAF495_27345 [Pseudomonadota bacterium]
MCGTRLALALVLLATVAACGQLPRPFQPDDKAANKLLDLEDRAGVLVLPLQGDGPGQPEQAAEHLAEALRDRDLPASTQNGHDASRVLLGHAAVLKLSPERDEVMVHWELSDPAGKRLAVFTQRSELPAGAWRLGDEAVVGKLMDKTAASVSELVFGPEHIAAPIPGFPGARLVILPFENMPGDGETSLSRALHKRLQAHSLPVVDYIEDDDLLIACDVLVGVPDRSVQPVVVTWRVLRASNGEVLGEIQQANQVPKGSLDGPWGPTAGAIADGATVGILQLIGQLNGA